MNSLIVACAQYLPYVIVAAAAVLWLMLARLDKVGLAVKGVVTLVLVGLLIVIGSALHTDPRPFVVDPSVRPLFPHPNDNGFPSDHTALSIAVAALVWGYRQALGVVLGVLALVVGAARVLAHVHHTQDIVAGAVFGLIAATLASLAWQAVEPRVAARFDRTLTVSR